MKPDFDAANEAEFLAILSGNVRSSIGNLETAGADWELVGGLLSNTPALGMSLKGVNWKESLWPAVKTEFHSFLCTESDAYKDVRSQWKDLQIGGPSVIVASVAGAIGAQLGMVSGVLIPIVVWLCVVSGRIGKNALCATLLPTQPTAPAVLGDSATPAS